jgi:hypothetical protein
MMITREMPRMATSALPWDVVRPRTESLDKAKSDLRI